MAAVADTSDLTYPVKEVHDKVLKTGTSEVAVKEILHERDKVESSLGQPLDAIIISQTNENMQVTKGIEVTDVHDVNNCNTGAIEGENFLQSPSVADGKPEKDAEENQFKNSKELSGSENKKNGGIITNENIKVESDLDQDCSANESTDAENFREACQEEEKRDDAPITEKTPILHELREMSFKGDDVKSKTNPTSQRTELDYEITQPNNLIVVSCNDETQNQSLESPVVGKVEDECSHTVESVEIPKEASENGLKDIVMETQNEADNQKNDLENITEALTMECKHEVGENVATEEQDQKKTPENEEQLEQSVTQNNEPTEENTESLVHEASEEVKATAPGESPNQIQEKECETTIFYDTERTAIPAEKNLSEIDLNGKNGGVEVAIGKTDNHSNVNSLPVEEVVQLATVQKNEASVPEPEDQVHEAFEVPKGEYELINETCETRKSPEDAVLAHLVSEETVNTEKLERCSKMNTEKELKEINNNDSFTEKVEQEDKAYDEVIQIATKSDGDKKRAYEGGAEQEADHHDTENYKELETFEKEEPRSDTEEDQSARTANDIENANAETIKKEECEDAKMPNNAKKTEVMKNEEHTVANHKTDYISEEITQCNQENETVTKNGNIKVLEVLRTEEENNGVRLQTNEYKEQKSTQEDKTNEGIENAGTSVNTDESSITVLPSSSVDDKIVEESFIEEKGEIDTSGEVSEIIPEKISPYLVKNTCPLNETPENEIKEENLKEVDLTDSVEAKETSLTKAEEEPKESSYMGENKENDASHVEVLKEDGTSGVGSSNNVDQLETNDEENPSIIELEKEKPEHEMASNEASKEVEACGRDKDTKMSSLEDNDSAKNLEKCLEECVEMEKEPVEFEEQGHSTLSKMVHRNIETYDENEIIDKQSMEDESCSEKLHTISKVDKTVNEEPEEPSMPKLLENETGKATEKSAVAPSLVSQVPKEEINERSIEDTKSCDGETLNAPVSVNEVTSLAEIKAIDEPVKAFDIASDPKTPETIQQQSEVDCMQLEEVSIMEFQLPEYEIEKEDHECKTTERTYGDNLEVEKTTNFHVEAESKVQNVQEAHETSTSPTVGDTDTNEIEEVARELPEALHGAINEGYYEAESNEKIAHGSETTNTIENAEDDNSKLLQTSGMVSQLLQTDTEEKSDADEGKAEGIKGFDTERESKGQNFKEINEITRSTRAEIFGEGKMEEEKEAKTSESIIESNFHGVKDINEIEQTPPAGKILADGEKEEYKKIPETIQVPSSPLCSNKQNSETGTTVNEIEDEMTEKIETELTKLDADEVEEAQFFESISESKVHIVEEIHEIKVMPPVGETRTDEEKEEIKAVPETVFEPNNQGVGAIIDEDSSLNQTLLIDGNGQLPEHDNEKEDRESKTMEKTDADDIEVEKTTIVNAGSESELQKVQEIHETRILLAYTDEDEMEKPSREAPEALSEPTNHGLEATSIDEIATPTLATEFQLNDEPIKVIDTNSSTKSIETTETGDTSQQDAEVEKINLGNATSIVSRLPIHEYEETDNESINVDVEVEETKSPTTASEYIDQGAEDIHKTGLSPNVGRTDTNEIEEAIKVVPEELSKTPKDDVAKDSNHKDAHNQTIQAEQSEGQLQESSSILISREENGESETKTTIGNKEDGQTTKEDTEDNLKLQETSGMVSQLLKSETMEKSNADEGKLEDAKAFDAVCKSKDQSYEEIHKIEKISTVEISDEDKVEDEYNDISEKLLSPTCAGVETIVASQTQESPLPVAKSEDKIMEKIETELVKSEADKVEEAKSSQSTSEFNVHCVEATQEIELVSPVGKTQTDKEKEEIKPIEAKDSLLKHDNEKEDHESITVEKTDADDVEAEKPNILNAESESEVQNIQETHETISGVDVGSTDSDRIGKLSRETPQSELTISAVEAASNDENITPTGVPSLMEFQLDDESVKVSDSEQDTEVDKVKREDAPSTVSCVPEHEHEEPQAESANVIDLEVEETKSCSAVTEIKDQTFQDINETDINPAVGETNTYESEKAITEVPEAILNAISQGVEVDSNDEIAAGQTIQAEKIKEQVQSLSSVSLSGEGKGKSETTTTMENTGDGNIKKDNNLNPQETSGMVSQLLKTQTAEKSDAGEGKEEEAKGFDAICEPKDQGSEEIQEVEKIPTLEISDGYKMEEEYKEVTEIKETKTSESIIESNFHGVEDIKEIGPIPTAEKIHTDEENEELRSVPETVQISLSALLCSNKKEDENMEKIEMELEESDAGEIEEANPYDSMTKSKVVSVEEIDEIEPTPPVGNTHTDEEKEEIKAVPDTFIEPSYQGVGPTIDGYKTSNKALQIESEEPLEEPCSALFNDWDHETTTDVEMIEAKVINKNDSVINKEEVVSFETDTEKKSGLEDKGPGELEVFSSDVTVQDTQNRTTVEESRALEEIVNATEKSVDVSSLASQTAEEEINEANIKGAMNYGKRTSIAPNTVTEGTSLGENKLIDEPVKAFGISSDAKTPETIQTIATSQEESEVDSVKVEETTLMESQLPEHENETEAHESIKVEQRDADDVEVENPKTHVTVRDSDTNESEKIVKEVAEAINQGSEADSNNKISTGQTVQAENIGEQVQVSSSVFLSSKESHDSETTTATTVENTVDGHTEKDDTEDDNLKLQETSEADRNNKIFTGQTVQAENIEEQQVQVSPSVFLSSKESHESGTTTATTVENTVDGHMEKDEKEDDNLKLQDTSGMASQLLTIETREQSDAVEVKTEEERRFEAVREFKVHLEEIHETETSPTVEISYEDQLGEEIGEVPEAKNQGSEADSNNKIFTGQTVQAENIEGQQVQVSPSVFLSSKESHESGTTTATTVENTVDGHMEKDDKEDDNLKPQDTSGMASQLLTTETREQSDAVEVKTEEERRFEAVRESKVHLEQIHETETSPTVEISYEDQLGEEIGEVPEAKNQGSEADSNNKIFTGQTVQAENIEEQQVQVSPSVFLSSKESHESGTTTATTVENTVDGHMEKDDKEDDNLKLQDTSGMASQLLTTETREQSNAVEVKTEEERRFEAVCESKVHLEEIHETETSPTVEISYEDQLGEEINDVAEKISGPTYPNVQEVVDGTDEQPPSAGKLEEELQVSSYSFTLLSNEQDENGTSVEKIEDASIKESETEVKLEGSTGKSECPPAKQENADMGANIINSDAYEIEEAKVSESLTETKVLGVEEIQENETKSSTTVRETRTDKGREETETVPETIFEPKDRGVGEIIDQDVISNQTLPIENISDVSDGKTDIAPTTVPQMTSMGEIKLIDEAVKAFDIRSDTNTPEIIQTADTTQQDSEVDSMKLEETFIVKPQLPENENEKDAHETAERTGADTVEFETTKKFDTESESEVQNVQEIQTCTNLGVGNSDANESEKAITGEVDEKCEAACDFELEKIEKALQSVSEIQDPEVAPMSGRTVIYGEKHKEAVTKLREDGAHNEEIDAAHAIHKNTSTEMLIEESGKDGTNNTIEEAITADGKDVENPQPVSEGTRTDNTRHGEEEKNGKNVDRAPIEENHGRETKHRNIATEATGSTKEVKSPEVVLVKHEDKSQDNNENNEIAKADTTNSENHIDNEKLEALAPACEGIGTSESANVEEQEASANMSNFSSYKTTSEEVIADKGENTIDQKHESISSKQTTVSVSLISCEEEQAKDEKPVKPLTKDNQEAVKDVAENKEIIKDPQELEKISTSLSHEQIARKEYLNENTENTNSIANRDFQVIQEDSTATASQSAEVGDLKAGYESGLAKQVEYCKEGNIGEEGSEVEKPPPTPLAEISLSELLHKSSKETKQVIEHMSNEEQKNEAEERALNEGGKTDKERDEDEEDEHKTADLGSDAPVMGEALRDIVVKTTHKKSHNILSGVGSKVKHSIAKVKKAITGKSSHQKGSSLKEDKKTEGVPSS